MGLVAVVFWSTIVALIRSLVEELGPFMFLTVTSGGGGLLLFLVAAARSRSLTTPLNVGAGNLVRCGIPFILYFVGFAVCLHLAHNRQMAIQLGLVNYLWPASMLLLSIPLRRRKSRPVMLATGMLLATGGAVLGTVNPESLRSLLANLTAGAPLFLLMFAAVVCWALYSNLVPRRDDQRPNGVPLYHMLTGLVAFIAAMLGGEEIHLGLELLPELAYVTVFPTAIGYLWWETGMKYGRDRLLNVVSYALPVSSTLFACWYLQVALSLHLLMGSLAVFTGAYLSWRAFEGKGDDNQ
jgi:drug/metabolite transporter (DMT)-like permease